MELLRGHVASDLEVSTCGDVLPHHVASDVQGATRLDTFRLQRSCNASRARSAELLDGDVAITAAGPGDARDLRHERALDLRASSRFELHRPNRVPGHDARSDDLDRLVAQLRPDAGELHRPHRVLRGPRRLLRGLRGAL